MEFKRVQSSQKKIQKIIKIFIYRAFNLTPYKDCTLDTRNKVK